MKIPPFDVFAHPLAISTPSTRVTSAHRVLGFFSSRPNWDIPPPHPQESLYPPFGSGGGTHSVAGEGRGVPIRTRGQTLLYSRSTRICTLCVTPSNPLPARPARYSYLYSSISSLSPSLWSHHLATPILLALPEHLPSL
jgi:hypothetical protein